MRTSEVFRDSEDLAYTAPAITIDVDAIRSKIELLKIKIKTLTEETKIVRHHEHKHRMKYKDIILYNELQKGCHYGMKIRGWKVTHVGNDHVVLSKFINTNADGILFGDGFAQKMVTKYIDMRPRKVIIPSEQPRIALHEKRVNELRNTQRAYHLAYAFLRGHTYSSTENSAKLDVIFDEFGYREKGKFRKIIVPQIVDIVNDAIGQAMIDATDIYYWMQGFKFSSWSWQKG